MQRKRATMKARCLNFGGCRTLLLNTALGLLPALVFSANIASGAESGSLVVERVGDGSAVLKQFRNPGVSGRVHAWRHPGALSIALPKSVTRPTSAPFNLMESGSASSDGLLTRSVNGLCLQIPGYNGIPGEAGIAGSGNTRTIGVINGAGVVDTSRSLAMFNANNFRGVVSVDGTAFWAAGTSTGSPNQGVAYVGGGSRRRSARSPHGR